MEKDRDDFSDPRGVSRRSFLRSMSVGAAALSAPPLLTSRVWSAPHRTQAGEAYRLETPVFRLAGAHGKLTELAVDPSGGGDYEPAALLEAYLGTVDIYEPSSNNGVKALIRPNSLELSDINVPRANQNLAQPRSDAATLPLENGHSFGQSFTAAMDSFHRVAIRAATHLRDDCGFTLTLYAGQPDGELRRITRQRFRRVATDAWVHLDVPPQPRGVYYLEMTEPVATPGWWYRRDEPQTARGTVVPPASPVASPHILSSRPRSMIRAQQVGHIGGSTFVDRVVEPGQTMTFEVAGVLLGAIASWRFDVDGRRLLTHYRLWTPDGEPVADPGVTLRTPWQRDGYSVDYDDGVLFAAVVSDDGRYLPAEQLKRRDWWGMDLDAPRWVHLRGSGPYDLRVSSPSRVRLNGDMDDESMTLRVAGSAATSSAVEREIALEVFEARSWLPNGYPVFTTSDVVRGEQLTQFFYERAFSFPFWVTAADWKDWQGRILDWSATGGRDGERDSLLDIRQDPDGYVWSQRDRRDWPFPDPSQYDTRHFTTNAMYVLGACRYYAWTGDEGFLAAMLPRIRAAMVYYLNELGGGSGLLTISAPQHSGVPQAIGSNYWDLASFGYSSAYCNAYFYAALGALSELERHVGDDRRADELDALATRCHQRFNEQFWDDSVGRYIQAVDHDGGRHDYGSAYVNLEAAALGLASPEQARRIFAWLEEGSTELTETLLAVPEPDSRAAPSRGQGMLEPGGTLGQTFTVDDSFSEVAAWVSARASAGFTLTLRERGPDGPVVASRRFLNWWAAAAFAALPVETRPAGDYYLELAQASEPLVWLSGFAYADGTTYADGMPIDVPARGFAVIGGHRTARDDIYDRWVFAPRTTTRRNTFWYVFAWPGLRTPWEQQLQDGGAALYVSGFDVLARARLSSADDAWKRMTEILDRWAEPDHLCGGDPLYRGEHPQGETAGAVGVDLPFPESGLAPASFLYAFIGLEATPGALTIRPNLPTDLTAAAVHNVSWRGQQLSVEVTPSQVTVSGADLHATAPYQPGQIAYLHVGARELVVP